MWNVINCIDKQQIVANVDVDADADAATATDFTVILKSALIFWLKRQPQFVHIEK